MNNPVNPVNPVQVQNLFTFNDDAIGRRVQSIIGSTTTQYYYDGQRVLLDTDGSGVSQRYYVWGNYIDEALMMRKLTGTAADYYYGHDHLYSACVLFNGSGGTIAERYEYDAYGKMYRLNADFTDFSGTEAGNPYYFTGRELDSIDGGSLKIMYYRARSYDPTTGRFLQRDPIGMDPSTKNRHLFNPLIQYRDGKNLFLYADNDPIVKFDSSGLTSRSECCEFAKKVADKNAVSQTICCDGKPIVCFYDPDHPDPGNNRDNVDFWVHVMQTRCSNIHEKQHIRDFPGAGIVCPQTCGPYIPLISGGIQKQLECRAHVANLKCLVTSMLSANLNYCQYSSDNKACVQKMAYLISREYNWIVTRCRGVIQLEKSLDEILKDIGASESHDSTDNTSVHSF